MHTDNSFQFCDVYINNNTMQVFITSKLFKQPRELPSKKLRNLGQFLGRTKMPKVLPKI